MKCLYIAWQDPQTRTWHTVGRLTRERGLYRFGYTRGALDSPRFTYLGRMHDLRKGYVSESLFPLFSNRLLDRSRPEYPDYVQWLGVAAEKPIRCSFSLVPAENGPPINSASTRIPSRTKGGEIELFFFSHGLRYLDERARRHIEQLKAGDFLQLKPDDDNVHDRYALGVQTEEPVRVGYCPRYLNRNLRRAMDVAEIMLMVERVNPEAPLQFRLLCKAVFMPPPSFDLFATDAYQPLAEEAAAA